jgi:hypothetical protein
MSFRFAVVVLAAGSLVAPAFADNAQRRGGGSPSPSAGSRHPSGGSGSGSARSRSGGGSSPSASQGRPSPGSGDRTIAERRHPRAGTGTGSFPGYGYHPGYYPGYYPGWYYPYWPSYYYGLYYGSGWGPYGYYGGGYYGGGPAYYSYRTEGDSAAVRVLVDPEKAKVYVDGYYAGVADDFDGMFQRLHLGPGRHELMFKLDGYRTHKMLVYVSPGQTLKIEHDLEKGTGPETFEDLTGGRGAREEGNERPAYRDDDDNKVNDEFDHPAPAPRGGEQPYRPDASRLRLDVRPADASVYLDGQFQGSAGELGELMLPPGSHRVEVVRPGFRTEERDIQLNPGSSRTVTIELARP